MFLEQRLQAEARVSRVVVRLLMLVPDKGDGEQESAARLQDSRRLGQELVGIEDVLEDLIAQNGVEGRRLERKAVTVVELIGDAQRPSSWRVDVEADVFVDGEIPGIGLRPAPNVEEPAAKSMRFLT